MVSMWKTGAAGVLLGIALIITGVGALFAQSGQGITPTPGADEPAAAAPTLEVTLSPDDCAGAGLATLKAGLDRQLEDFVGSSITDPNAALADLYAVGVAYQQLALNCGYLPEDLEGLVVDTTDVGRVLTALDTLAGDPLRGQLLYTGQESSASGDRLGCAGCHEAAPGAVSIAPPTEGTWTRWDEVRSLDPRFADYSFEQYTLESILLPWDYFVPTYPEYTMPDFYHTQLGYQDLADIVAFLSSQDQLIEN